MSSVWIGATGRRPAAEVLVGSTGARIPFSLPADRDTAFDHGVARNGWVAVELGNEAVISLLDGDWWHPVQMRGCWEMLPAYDESLLIVKRDAIDGDDRLAIELVDARGQVLRSVSSAWTNLAGQLSSGELVCVDPAFRS